VHRKHNPFHITVKFHSEALTESLQLPASQEYDIFHFLEKALHTNTRFTNIRDKLGYTTEDYQQQETRELNLLFVDLLMDRAVLSGVHEVRPDSMSSIILSTVHQKILRDLEIFKIALKYLEHKTMSDDIASLDSAPQPSGCSHYNSRGQRMVGLCARYIRNEANVATPADHKGDVMDLRSLQLMKFRTDFCRSFLTLKHHRVNDMNYHDGGADNLSRLQMPANPINAWEMALYVVRNLFLGKVPKNVHEVIFCVMAAHALRKETSCYSFDQEEYVSTIEPCKLLTSKGSLKIFVNGETC
jgi:hypothetical protein